MTIWIGGHAAWTTACDQILTSRDIPVQWVDPESEPADPIGVLSGSSSDWYPFLDRVLRRSSTVLLGNPGSWSLHDLLTLERIADESGARVVTYRPWRSLLDPETIPTRQARLRVTCRKEERWKPLFGHAVDLLVQQVGTDHLLRTDASRSTDMKRPGAQLLCHMRFQNGAVAHLALEREGEQEEGGTLELVTPSIQIRAPFPEDSQTLDQTIDRLLHAADAMPNLQQAIAGRKIEEKIFSILRSP